MHANRFRVRALALTLCALTFMGALGFVGYQLYLAERRVPPPAGAGPTQVAPPLDDRLVIVVIDALREDIAFDETIMPHFNALAARGASGVSITPPMTLTTMSVLNMGTGMTPAISWSIKNFDAEPFEDESLPELLHATGHRIALLGDASWTQLFGRYAAKTLSIRDSGFYKGADADMIETDAQVLDEAERVLADPSFDVVVIHVVGTDKAAHAHGAHRREQDGSLSMYARRVAAVDARLGQLYERFGERGTWLVTSDHGTNLAGNHGGGEVEARRAPFVLVGRPVVPQRDVEQSLNAIAPTLAVIEGVRTPRTAEVPANFGLLALEPMEQARHALAHLRTREAYTEGYLQLLGAALELPPDNPLEAARRALAHGEAKQAVVMASNGMGILQALLAGAEGGRQGLRSIGVGLGLLAMVLLLWLIGSSAGQERPLGAAVVWAGLSWALLSFGEWQFSLIWLLGEMWRSWAHFVWHGPIAVGLIGGLTLAVWLVRKSPAMQTSAPAWIGWAVIALFLGQSVMRWPYGPLLETYRFLLLAALLGAGLFARGRTQRLRVLGAAACFGVLYMLAGRLLPSSDQVHVTDSFASTFAADALLAGALLALGVGAARGAADSAGRLWTARIFAVLAGLAVAAAVYRISGTTWLVKSLVPVLLVPLLLLSRAGASPLLARNTVLGLALVLYRALSLDARVILALCFGAAAILLSGVRTRRNDVAVPAAAAIGLLAHQSYFHEIGHAYSFSAIDVSVAFAATRDAIHLGEGFVFILLQHLGPWLTIVAALMYNRMISNDRKGLYALAPALLGAFAIQCWGAFATFEWELDNHWFTIHAVPLFLFAMCNALLMGLSLVIAGSIARGKEPVTTS